MILSGHAADDNGEYGRGDVVVQPSGSEHCFEVEPASECVALIVNEGPMTSEQRLVRWGLRVDAWMGRALDWIAPPPRSRPSAVPPRPRHEPLAADPQPDHGVPSLPRYSELLRLGLPDPADEEPVPRERLDELFHDLCGRLEVESPDEAVRPSAVEPRRRRRSRPHHLTQTRLVDGRVVMGSWRLGRQLGRGGFGVVFEAHHTRIPTLRRAIKFLLPCRVDDEDVRRRFHVEAAVMADLRGPNLVEITDYGETEDGIPFLAMELLEGESLAQRLRTRGPVSIPELVTLGGQILDGVAQIHAGGVVHRDLKPSNIVVAAPTEQVKLLDFGLAKTASSHTVAGVLMGTPNYMAPEVLMGHAATERSDLYAASVVLFQMLTGQLPHPRDRDLVRFAMTVSRDSPRSLQDLRPDVPPHITDAIARAMAKDPGRRTASAARMRRDLLGDGEVEPSTCTVSLEPV